jgi:hypothetical protein
MEPLHPELRAELKRVHPGLDDRTIDEYESLTSLRFGLDPERDKGRLAEIDAARLRLLQARMPHYPKVRGVFLARRRVAGDTTAPAVQVDWRDASADGDDAADGTRRP